MLTYLNIDQAGNIIQTINIIDQTTQLNQQNNIIQQSCINEQENINQQMTLSQGVADHCMPISNTNHSIPLPVGEESEENSNKSRKEKSKKSQWRKEKGNKYLNKPYRNYKGVEVKSKEFVDYDCKCTMKCKEILSTSERKQEFKKFWELGSYEAQAIFLIARVDEQITKKSTKKKKDKKDDSDEDTSSNEGKKSKRQFSRTYILKSKQVCRDMFVKTLGITSKRINTALVKMRSKSLVDFRGISQGGKNKISDDRYDEVVQHIKKMPRCKCIHMQGKYEDYSSLPPELSLSKMYDLYSKEVEQPVSLSMYKKIYYGRFNFAKGVKREVCNICKNDRKMKNAELKKQQTLDKMSLQCPNNQIMVSNQIMMPQEQYQVTTFIPQPQPITCNQTWLAPASFQVAQPNPTYYFEQPMIYEMN